MIEVRKLDAAEARRKLSALAAVLVDCVEGGASVSFMWPFSQNDAELFFNKVMDGLEREERFLFAAYDGATLIGAVQIVTATPPNQPHRAEFAKLLVHRSARGKGVGAALMHAAEEYAKALGKTLLMLDAVTGGDAERLYLRLNWTKAAVIPNYAMFPDGRWCDTTIFWKAI
jgi:GNAT superfamily N-acetyltransferase